MKHIQKPGRAMSIKSVASIFRYLYFDIPRTVQIVGGQALADANKTILSSALVNRSNSTNQVPYCLTGIDSATTAALHVSNFRVINIKLSSNLPSEIMRFCVKIKWLQRSVYVFKTFCVPFHGSMRIINQCLAIPIYYSHQTKPYIKILFLKPHLNHPGQRRVTQASTPYLQL